MEDIINLADLGLGAGNARRVLYRYAIDFDGDIAAGASSEKAVQLRDGGAFFCQSLMGVVWAPTPTAGDANMSFPDSGGIIAASNTYQDINSCRLEVRTTDTPWQSAPIKLGLYVGTAKDPGYLQTSRRISENDTLRAKLYNDSNETVRAQIVFVGFRLERL